MPDSNEQLISVESAPPAEAPTATTEQGDGESLDSAAAIKKKRVQMAIIGALLIVVALIVTDQATKRCTYQPQTTSTTKPVPPEPTPCYQAALRSFIAWVRQNPGLGALAVIVVYACAAILFIPGSVITLGVGAAFARALGTPVRTLNCAPHIHSHEVRSSSRVH